jgi:hypothetical protein
MRNIRQKKVTAWVVDTFGEQATAVEERTTRFIEEAIELAQAAGLPRERVEALVARIYDRPAGEPAQEIGGVGVTLLALSDALGVWAEDAEKDEFSRILSKSADHFRARQNAKADAGVGIHVA